MAANAETLDVVRDILQEKLDIAPETVKIGRAHV